MSQKLNLNVSKVTLFTGRGADQLTIHVPASHLINEVTKNKLEDGFKGKDIFCSDLCFELRISKDCGENLVQALGLVITERIDL